MKEHFLKIVQAPGEPFMVQASTKVPEQSVSGSMQPQSAVVLACRSRFKLPNSGTSEVVRTEINCTDMPLEAALKVKSAEFWLKLGEPAQALIEIQNLPELMQTQPWPLKIHLAAIGAIRESTLVQV